MEDLSLLQRMQGAPHETKVRWLMALTIIFGAVAVWIWLAALPAMVAIRPPATEANPHPKPQLTGVASLLQSFQGQ